jgi:hypothetical protein
MALLGLGIGLTMQVLAVASQNAARRRDLGVVTSLAQFLRELGGAVGVAALGAVFASRIAAQLSRRLPPAAARVVGSGLHGSPAQLNTVVPAVHHAVTRAVAAAVDTVFAWALPVTALALLLTLFLPQLPLRDSHDHPQLAPDPGDESPVLP